jgi:hypothetical protein
VCRSSAEFEANFDVATHFVFVFSLAQRVRFLDGCTASSCDICRGDHNFAHKFVQSKSIPIVNTQHNLCSFVNSGKRKRFVPSWIKSLRKPFSFLLVRANFYFNIRICFSCLLFWHQVLSFNNCSKIQRLSMINSCHLCNIKNFGHQLRACA